MLEINISTLGRVFCIKLYKQERRILVCVFFLNQIKDCVFEVYWDLFFFILRNSLFSFMLLL
jgi:hypothetical protein